MVALNEVLQQGKDQIATDVDGEVVMMSVQQGEYYGLDSVGSRIWELFEQPKTTEQVIDVLTAEYEVDRKTCEQDVIQFVDELMGKGLLIKA